VNNDTSFENVRNKWVPEIRKRMGDVPIVLVGTKIDLRDDPVTRKKLLMKKKMPISYEQGELMARKMGCVTYIETSSMKGIGFSDMTQVIVSCSLAFKERHAKTAKKGHKKCCLQ